MDNERQIKRQGRHQLQGQAMPPSRMTECDHEVGRQGVFENHIEC